MKSKLSSLCSYRKGKIAVSELDSTNYISTENMLADKGGITKSSGLPASDFTQAYYKNDVLVSNIRPYFKKIWFANMNGGCSNDVLVFTANNECEPSFLYYVLSNDDFFNYATVTAKGTKMPRGDKKAIMEYEVPIYDIDTQKKIASILSALDDKIEVNKKINENLYNMCNAYYLNIIKNENCNLISISDCVDKIYSGGTPSTSKSDYWNGNYKWFSSGETRNKFVISTEKTITEEGVKNSSTKLASKYDIVMASAGQGFTRGQTSMLLTDTYINQSVIVIHADKIMTPYLFFNLANRYDELRSISDSSSIRGSITTKMIASFEIYKPDNEILKEFSNFAWKAISKIENNLLENERLTKIRDTLLPKLMNGEIDINGK